MAYDEGLAERIRAAIGERPGVEERRMFGGLAFMVDGHMACGVVGDDLMARVGKDDYEGALAEPHARPMDFTGRPLSGMVHVAAQGIEDDAALARWVERTTCFAATLPPRA